MKRRENGFTLIELVTVSALLVFVSVILVKSFSERRLDMKKIATEVASDIRMAQANALSSKKYQGTFRCGYGINRDDSSAYRIYAGKDTNAGNCNPTFIYTGGSTPEIARKVMDTRVTIRPFNDIFFFPPDPKVYIGPGVNPATSPERITIRKAGLSSCTAPKDCIYVCVFPSGRIEIFTDSALCN